MNKVGKFSPNFIENSESLKAYEKYWNLQGHDQIQSYEMKLRTKLTTNQQKYMHFSPRLCIDNSTPITL